MIAFRLTRMSETTLEQNHDMLINVVQGSMLLSKLKRITVANDTPR